MNEETKDRVCFLLEQTIQTLNDPENTEDGGEILADRLYQIERLACAASRAVAEKEKFSHVQKSAIKGVQSDYLDLQKSLSRLKPLLFDAGRLSNLYKCNDRVAWRKDLLLSINTVDSAVLPMLRLVGMATPNGYESTTFKRDIDLTGGYTFTISTEEESYAASRIVLENVQPD